jgi:hypothetical protein
MNKPFFVEAKSGHYDTNVPQPPVVAIPVACSSTPAILGSGFQTQHMNTISDVEYAGVAKELRPSSIARSTYAAVLRCASTGSSITPASVGGAEMIGSIMQEDDNRRSFHSDQRPFEFADAARRLTASHRPAYVHRSRTPNWVTAEKKLMKSMVENGDGKSSTPTSLSQVW